MTRIEEELRQALDESAQRVPVDTTRMWQATRARIRPRANRRRRLVLVPLAAIAAVALVAIAIPLGGRLLEPAPEQTTPTATEPAKPQRPAPPWQYEFTDPPPKAYAKAMAILGRNGHPAADGRGAPVDYPGAPKEAVVLAYYAPEPPDDHAELCWVYVWLDNGYGESCQAAGVPSEDPSIPSNKWLTSDYLRAYPPFGGDGQPEPDHSILVGQAKANGQVARVDGIDRQGRHHRAKLVAAPNWPTMEYFVVVKQPIELKWIAAYDDNGKLLGKVPAAD